jgi:hypothetical protein
MTTLLTYEVDFGSAIYQTHAIQSIQIVLPFITKQGSGKMKWEDERICNLRKMKIMEGKKND